MPRAIKVTKGYSLSWTALGAGRDVFILLQIPPPLCICLCLGPHEPVVTEGTLLHYTSHPRGNLWREISIHTFRERGIKPVEIPCLIWTCSHTVSTAYAPCIDLAHYSGVWIFSRGCCRANRDTGGIIALHTWPGDIDELGFWEPFSIR